LFHTRLLNSATSFSASRVV